ncbi:hypothetical protein LOTGIDRAFT_230243 [Lottia gigantea]|uniref:Small ribosomal subunit protein mS33 n=1 Tax=Lottia gigantea TaxID=225164 RepID=V4AIN0_LOTGI|nr:hypothetical protein LOTGIDRAFT_230243 [Lottia gigantea]ESP03949.1 hypothetical protein LOTGIDRAFT_230243 [Lottia gigantea]
MASNYAKRMNRLAGRIFGEVTRPFKPGQQRIVRIFAEKPVHKKMEVMEYYPRVNYVNNLMKVLRNHGLYRDEHADLVEEYKERREARGKVKPKKGEGKRSLKRKG